MRPLYILAAILGIGALIVFLERPDRPRGDQSVVKIVPSVEGISKIAISQMADGLVLEIKSGKWVASTLQTPLAKKIQEQSKSNDPVMESVDVDGQKLGRAVAFLDDLKSHSIASQNPSEHPDWQLNELGTRVQAWDKTGKPITDIYLGKMGPDMVSTFVRREGENTVYLVTGFLAGQFPAKLEYWKDDTQDSQK